LIATRSRPLPLAMQFTPWSTLDNGEVACRLLVLAGLAASPHWRFSATWGLRNVIKCAASNSKHMQIHSLVWLNRVEPCRNISTSCTSSSLGFRALQQHAKLLGSLFSRNHRRKPGDHQEEALRHMCLRSLETNRLGKPLGMLSCHEPVTTHEP